MFLTGPYLTTTSCLCSPNTCAHICVWISMYDVYMYICMCIYAFMCVNIINVDMCVFYMSMCLYMLSLQVYLSFFQRQFCAFLGILTLYINRSFVMQLSYSFINFLFLLSQSLAFIINYLLFLSAFLSLCRESNKLPRSCWG